MKDKVFHDSSQSDENNEVSNRGSTSAFPPFIPAGKSYKRHDMSIPDHAVKST